MPRLLLIENNPSLRLLYKMELSRAGYAVDTAESLAEGVEQIRTSPPDVAVSEIRLPDSDGPDTYRMIRQDGGNSLPLVINTGSEAFRSVLPENGRTRYLVKSSDVDALVNSVRELLAVSGDEMLENRRS